MKPVAALTVAAFTAIMMSGCTKDSTGPDQSTTPPSGVTNEQQAMQYYASQDAFVQNLEATFEDTSLEAFDYGTLARIDTSITPLRFGRFISGVQTDITVEPLSGDSLAVAHVQKNITGTFKVSGIKGSGDTVTVSKPFEDIATRNIIFKRIANNADRFWLNWLPVATSLVKGGTASRQDQPDILLTKAQLFLPGGDSITIVEPNAFYLRYRWTRLFDGGNNDVPEVVAGASVRLEATVVSASPDTDLVAMRIGIDAMHHRRIRMHLVSSSGTANTFTRVYSIQFTLPMYHGWFHIGIDAMSRATLFDDTAAYSVSWWGIPYRVF
jgi:hypothetical protein